MNTKSSLRGAAAAVSGARHVRTGRNGQDAAGVWVAPSRGVGSVAGCRGAVVVCDGCGSGASSEVGARIAAELVIGAVARRLGAAEVATPSLGELEVIPRTDRETVDVTTPSFWTEVRAEIVAALEVFVRAMPGPRERVVHDYFLFTTLAAVMVGDQIAVWAIGDGVYAIDGVVRELGPFANNQPPYLGYGLLDDVCADSAQVAAPRFDANCSRAHVEVTRGHSVIVATDGVAEIGLDHFAGVDRFVGHPDALRRQLAILARGNERVDWDARRVARTPALLQDDGAVAMLVRGGAS